MISSGRYIYVQRGVFPTTRYQRYTITEEATAAAVERDDFGLYHTSLQAGYPLSLQLFPLRRLGTATPHPPPSADKALVIERRNPPHSKQKQAQQQRPIRPTPALRSSSRYGLLLCRIGVAGETHPPVCTYVGTNLAILLDVG